jgi:DNA-binding transcriptional LysR family regulator
MQDIEVLSNLNLNHLVVLLAVMREGSVTEAARILGRSQSAISHALSRLRDDLDDPLLVRSGLQLVATPRAEEITQQLEQLFPPLSTALAPQAPFDPVRAENVFSIAGSDLIQHMFASNLFHELERRAPNVRICLANHPADENLTDALAMDLDFSMSVSVPENNNLHSREIFEEGFSCVVRKNHPLLQGEDHLDLDTYAEMRHLLVAMRCQSNDVIDKELAKRGKTREVAITIPSFLAAGDLLLNSHLIATLPSKLANDLVGKYPSLQLYSPPLPTPSFKVKLAWHDRHDSEPSHQWMRETLVELLADASVKKRMDRGTPEHSSEVSEAHI